MLIFEGLQVALSPSYCSVVQIRNDGKIKWKQLEYHLGDIGSSMEDRRLSDMLSGNAANFTSTICCSGSSSGFILLYRGNEECSL
jgi:mediator of RNA polymerase II transcription subunit 16